MRLDRGRRATRATTGSTPDETTASAASQHGPVASTTWSTLRGFEMAFEPMKPGVEGLESGDPIRDVGTPLADESGAGGRVGAMTRMAPARDPASVGQRDVEPSKVDPEAQVLDVGLAVVAIVVVLRRAARPA